MSSRRVQNLRCAFVCHCYTRTTYERRHAGKTACDTASATAAIAFANLLQNSAPCVRCLGRGCPASVWRLSRKFQNSLTMARALERDYVLLESTVALCPQCLSRLDGKLINRGGSVYVSRWCPSHGAQLDLLEEDLQYYLDRNQFAKPSTQCTTQTESRNNCPFDCGLCPNHEQHTCIGLVEITTACSQGCPVCYAQSGKGEFVSIDDFTRRVEFAVESEGGALDILQLSGGEPTEHPQLIEMIKSAWKMGVKYVLLNTHGLTLAEKPDLVRQLAELKSGFEVYLQFDGVTNETHQRLRGKPLFDEKLQALDILSRNGIPTTLVMTVAAGVNDHEVGAIAVKALQTPSVRGVSYQTLAYFGRIPPAHIERTRRTTVSGIIRRLETQMKQMIRSDHLGPLPCDADRVAIGYFFKRPNGEFFPMVTRSDVAANLEQIKNTLSFSPEDFASCSPGSGCCGGVAGKVLKAFSSSFLTSSSVADKARFVSENTFRVSIASFVDPYNFDLRSSQRECVHVITPELRKIPFSAYNFHHRQKGIS